MNKIKQKKIKKTFQTQYCCLLIIFSVSTILISLSVIMLWHRGYFLNECFYEHGYLEFQAVLNNSLYIVFKPENGKPFQTHIYYFEGENNSLPYKDGSKITVRWCYVPAINDYRIRGVFEGWIDDF